ncbi:Peptidyl-prolyl cis-trans isomerase D, partial [Galemys pyrenaicus]
MIQGVDFSKQNGTGGESMVKNLKMKISIIRMTRRIDGNCNMQPLSCVLNISACKQMPNWQEATDSCLEALETDPSNTKVLYCRAQGWQGLEESDQALAELKKAQEVAPEDKSIQVELLKVKQKIKALKKIKRRQHMQ